MVGDALWEGLGGAALCRKFITEDGLGESLGAFCEEEAELCKAVESRNSTGNRMDTTWCRWRKGTHGRQEAEDLR